jgi:cell division protein FtsL
MEKKHKDLMEKQKVNLYLLFCILLEKVKF